MLAKQKKSGYLHAMSPARRRHQTRRSVRFEPLESRQMLNGAPVAVNDSYPLPNTGTIEVGSATGGQALDVSIPDPNDFTLDERITVDSGQQQHPGFLTIGGGASNYGEITVTNPGSSLTINQFLDVGLMGFGRVSVTNGGVLHTTNWTELGQVSGFGIGLVSGAGSRWINDNFFVVGDNQGRGRLTVEDGAAMTNGSHITVGDDGGQGTMIVSGGSTFTNLNWTEVAPHPGANGELIITGPGSKYTNREWMEIGGSPQSTGSVTVMDGGALEIGNFASIFPGGRLRGDGRIRIGGWFENRGTLEPGAPRGVMTLDANVTQFSESRLELDIGGLARGSGHDGLDVNGVYHAAGTLAVKFVNGFAPTAGDSFELVRAHSIDGTFSAVNIQGLAPGFMHTISIEDGVVRLTALNDGVSIPQPAGQGVLANDSDPDSDMLSALLVEGPAKGSLQLFAGGAFRYVAGPNFDGSDTFTYQATDGFAQSQPTVVTLINLPPIGQPDEFHAVEDESFVSPTSVLANDSDDMPNAALTARLVQFGSEAGTLDFRSDGTFTYTPRPNFSGNFSFLYVASDGLTESEIVVAEVFVEGRNDPPTARDDVFRVRQGESLSFGFNQLVANDIDPDGDQLTVRELLTSAEETRGQVVLVGGVATYTPDAGFVGTARLGYVVVDRDGLEDAGDIFIEVLPANRAPIANPDRKTMLQDTVLRFPAQQLVANDFDPDGDPLNVIGVGTFSADVTHGTVELEGDPENLQVVYIPEPGFVGTARFFYRASDGTDVADSVVVVEVKPLVQHTIGRVQGAGTLDGLERVFAFSANNRRGESATSGHLFFIDFEQRFYFQSTSVTLLEIAADGRRATFSGEGRFNGRSGFQFTVTIEDRNALGQRDKFRIEITGPQGFSYDSLAHAENDGRIDRSGNIRIEPLRPRTLVDMILARQIAFAEIGAAAPATKFKVLAR